LENYSIEEDIVLSYHCLYILRQCLLIPDILALVMKSKEGEIRNEEIRKRRRD